MHNLIIDIGNTRTKLGFFQEKELLEQAFLQNWTLSNLIVQLEGKAISHVILCASGEVPEGVEDWLESHYPYIRLTHETPLPIHNDYATPSTLGRDRLAGVVGAWAMFPDQYCLKIDAGTCLTYDWLMADGHYKGGIIAPGLAMRLRAMHEFTARLPLLTMADEPLLTGNSTQTAMQSGAQWGAIHEIQGFINHYQNQYGTLRVLLSGGDAAFLKKYLPDTVQIVPNLVLHGLNHILLYCIHRKTY